MRACARARPSQVGEWTCKMLCCDGDAHVMTGQCMYVDIPKTGEMLKLWQTSKSVCLGRDIACKDPKPPERLR